MSNTLNEAAGLLLNANFTHYDGEGDGFWEIIPSDSFFVYGTTFAANVTPIYAAGDMEAIVGLKVYDFGAKHAHPVAKPIPGELVKRLLERANRLDLSPEDFERTAALLREAATALNVRTGAWQDIATAPDTGEHILVWGPMHGVQLTQADGVWWRRNIDLKAVPTHWQPLPNPPALSSPK